MLFRMKHFLKNKSQSDTQETFTFEFIANNRWPVYLQLTPHVGPTGKIKNRYNS